MSVGAQRLSGAAKAAGTRVCAAQASLCQGLPTTMHCSEEPYLVSTISYAAKIELLRLCEQQGVRSVA